LQGGDIIIRAYHIMQQKLQFSATDFYIFHSVLRCIKIVHWRCGSSAVHFSL